MVVSGVSGLSELKRRLLAAASAETAYDPEKYTGGLSQHCGAVACLVKEIMGGVIVTAQVNGEQHIWNRVPKKWGGTIDLDLTSEQFGGNGFNPRSEWGRGRTLNPKCKNPRHKAFRAKVLA